MQYNNLIIIFANFGPYHLARLAAVAKLGREQNLGVIGIELAGREIIYPWQTGDNQGVAKYTLFPLAAVEEVPSWVMAYRMWAMLQRLNPQALAICGITGPGMLSALAWARYRKRVAVLMMATKENDKPRHPLKERLKGMIVSCFDAACVGGNLSQAYAIKLGIPGAKVFTGYDVVDNAYFAERAAQTRREADYYRNKYGLPENYFLCVSRFIDKKNISGLLKAYKRYCHICENQTWGLVICGSGPLETALKQQVQDLGLGQMQFAGFRQIDELPIFYSLSQCFIMPSSHFEQWGLVVNEAMASGLPVLVSKACGCAPDLVQEGVNGSTFDPYDVEGLARLMVKMSSGEVDLVAMGHASQRIIADWTPEIFAENLLKAVEAAKSSRSKKRFLL